MALAPTTAFIKAETATLTNVLTDSKAFYARSIETVTLGTGTLNQTVAVIGDDEVRPLVGVTVHIVSGQLTADGNLTIASDNHSVGDRIVFSYIPSDITGGRSINFKDDRTGDTIASVTSDDSGVMSIHLDIDNEWAVTETIASFAITSGVSSISGTSGQILTSASTGAVTLSLPATLFLGAGPAADAGSFSPLKWGGGSGYTLTGERTTFQSVVDNVGSITYNANGTSGDVKTALQFESRFKNSPVGDDSELFYEWDGPVGVTPEVGGRNARRVFQTGVSWGTQYGAPVGKEMGYASWALDVNLLTLRNGDSADHSLDVDLGLNGSARSGHTWRWWGGPAQFDGTFTVGGNLTANGTGTQTFKGPLNIQAATSLWDNANNINLTITPDAFDSAVTFTNTTNNYLRIGTAASGTLFGALASTHVFDTVAASAGARRPFLFRYSSNTGSAFSNMFGIDPLNTVVRNYFTLDASDTNVGAERIDGGLAVAKKAFFGDNVIVQDGAGSSDLIRISPTAISGNPGIYFKDSGSPGVTKAALFSNGSNIFLNAATGGSVFLRVANGNYFSLSVAGGYTLDNGNVNIAAGTLAVSGTINGLTLSSTALTAAGALTITGGGITLAPTGTTTITQSLGTDTTKVIYKFDLSGTTYGNFETLYTNATFAGSARPDRMLSSGYNQLGTITTEPGGGTTLETFYSPSGGLEYMEWYFQYNESADTSSPTSHRPFFTQINRAKSGGSRSSIATVIMGNSISLNLPSGVGSGTPLLVNTAGIFTGNSFGLTVGQNNVSALLQNNAAGNAYVELAKLNSSNELLLGGGTAAVRLGSGPLYLNSGGEIWGGNGLFMHAGVSGNQSLGLYSAGTGDVFVQTAVTGIGFIVDNNSARGPWVEMRNNGSSYGGFGSEGVWKGSSSTDMAVAAVGSLKLYVANSGTVSATLTATAMTFAGNVVSAGQVKAATVKTTAYTVATTDHIVVGNHATTPFTITMIDASSNTGREFIFKNKNAAAVTIDATGLGQFYSTTAVNTLVLSVGDSVAVVSDGSTWVVV